MGEEQGEKRARKDFGDLPEGEPGEGEQGGKKVRKKGVRIFLECFMKVSLGMEGKEKSGTEKDSMGKRNGSLGVSVDKWKKKGDP